MKLTILHERCTLDDHALVIVDCGPRKRHVACGVPCQCGRYVQLKARFYEDKIMGGRGGTSYVPHDQSRCFRCTKPWDDHPWALCDRSRC